MKIRIKGNSIRLRLSRPEVDYFAKEGMLAEKTEFGNVDFIYALMVSEWHEEMIAELTENRITVHIPAAWAHEWTTTEKVGYEGQMDVGNDKKLYILIEKDFKCLDNTIEDQSNNYPNPLSQRHE